MNRKNALILAITNEIKSQNLYALFSRVMKNKHAQDTFKKLAPMEQMHREKLTALFKKEFPQDSVDVSTDLLPTFHGADIEEDPKEIFRFAIMQEDKAAELYEKLANESTEKEVKELFLQLAQDEKDHHEYIEAEILQLEGQPVWFDISEISGLMEHH